MIDSTTIRSTIDDVKRAATALGVSPYGNDGLTFTRREFDAKTKGARVYWGLDTLRDRHAVVVDHSETFTHSASLIVSYCYAGVKTERLCLPAFMSEHDTALMLQTDNPIAAFASMSTDIAEFFANNNVNPKDVACCHYYHRDRKANIHLGYGTVTIQYDPEFEGIRYFYRFDLRGYLCRQSERVKDAITECEEQAAKYQELVAAKTAQAAEFRKLAADLNK